MGTTQRRSIGLTYNCVRINTFAPYFLQMLFWVRADCIRTRQILREKADCKQSNWLHEGRSFVSHTTFKNLGLDTNIQMF